MTFISRFNFISKKLIFTDTVALKMKLSVSVALHLPSTQDSPWQAANTLKFMYIQWMVSYLQKYKFWTYYINFLSAIIFPYILTLYSFLLKYIFTLKSVSWDEFIYRYQMNINILTNLSFSIFSYNIDNILLYVLFAMFSWMDVTAK